MESVRIVIDNPADADNIKPTFNPTGWVDTITIFCDEKSSAFDKCGVGAEINLLDFFNDSDGVGPQSSHMVFDIYDDPSSALDDDYDTTSELLQRVKRFTTRWIRCIKHHEISGPCKV